MNVDDALAWIPLRWLVFVHILSAFAFLMLHGPSIFAMMMLRRERDAAKARALLEMSRYASGWSWSAWALLAITGALVALKEHTWTLPWVWGSLVVLILVTGVMSPLAASAFNHARGALGLPWFDGKRMQPAGPGDPAALAPALERIRARAPLVLAIGTVGAVLLVWLMAYKPTF